MGTDIKVGRFFCQTILNISYLKTSKFDTDFCPLLAFCVSNIAWNIVLGNFIPEGNPWESFAFF